MEEHSLSNKRRGDVRSEGLSAKLRAFKSSDLGLTLISDLHYLIEDILIGELEKELVINKYAFEALGHLKIDNLNQRTCSFDEDMTSKLDTSIKRIGFSRMLECVPLWGMKRKPWRLPFGSFLNFNFPELKLMKLSYDEYDYEALYSIFSLRI